MTTTTLFSNETDGRIACTDHAGGYLRASLAERPNAKRWATPLGTWTRWTAADDAAWIAEFGKSAECEVCRSAR